MKALLSSLAFLLALGACGCADNARDAKAKRDEQDIRRVISQAMTGVAPSVCTTLRTRSYVEQTEAAKGRVAVRSCRASIARDAADAVDIWSVDVRGDSADARFALRGGSFDGQGLTVKLLRGKRSWRLDEVKDFDLGNRPKFDRALRAKLVSAPNALSESDASCIVRRLRSVSNSAIERSIVTGLTRYVTEPLLTCIAETAFREAGLSTAQTRCAIKRVRRRYTGTELEAFLRGSNDAASDRFALVVHPCLRRAARATPP